MSEPSRPDPAPRPGSPAALAGGCTCPTLVNTPAVTSTPLLAPDCPLHHAVSSGDTAPSPGDKATAAMGDTGG